MQKYFKTGRVIIALLFFVAILVAFADIKGNLPTHYFKGVFFLQFIPSVLEFLSSKSVLSIGFLVVLILTLIGGRIYCSIICPLGILQDIMIYLKRKFSAKQRFRFKKALNILRYSFLSVTLIYIIIAGTIELNRLFVLTLLDPYAIFGRIGSHIIQPVFLAINNTIARLIPSIGMHSLEARPVSLISLAIAASMFILVAVMTFFRGRLYCNSICPVGSILGLLSKLSFYKIKINQSDCTRCGKCQFVCKANCIDTTNMKVDETRCISCYNCFSSCSNSAIGYKRPISKTNKTEEEPASDSRRRLFLMTTITYLATKTIRLKAQPPQGNGEKAHKKADYYQRGTVTPPGSISLEHLKNRCVACHLCVSVCPTKVLQPSFLEYGFTSMMLPKMDFFTNFCNYECTKCGEVCPSGAIIKLPIETKKVTQIGKAIFQKDICVVETRHTACGSCSEHCPTQAVEMIPYENGLTIPHVDHSICIGCGGCEYACPVENPHTAIYVVANDVHRLVKKPTTEKIEYKESEEFPF